MCLKAAVCPSARILELGPEDEVGQADVGGLLQSDVVYQRCQHTDTFQEKCRFYTSRILPLLYVDD